MIWNDYVFRYLLPEKITIKRNIFLNPKLYKRLKFEDIQLANTVQVPIQLDLIYTNVSDLLTSALHPNKEVSQRQCTAMISDMARVVKVPCDKPILRNWICKVKKLERKQTDLEKQLYENVSICQNGQFMCNNGECITDVYVCDGQMDCRTGEDEHKCNVCNWDGNPYKAPYICRNICGIMKDCTCHFLYYTNSSFGCVPYTNPPNVKLRRFHGITV